MSRHTARARSGSDRTSLYDEITTKIMAELEAGRVPWVQPWGTAAAKAPLAMPKNAATGRQYSGINVLILWGSVIEQGFPVQGWVTFRQALSLGGNVRKGEHGTTVVYADRFIPDDEKKRAREIGEEAQAIPFLKRFTVFNLAQCEGLPEDLAAAAPPPEPGLIEPTVEALYLFGAICPARGKGVALALPHVDTEMMQLHLDEISRHVAKDAHAVLLLDRAGWHTTGKLAMPKNITPILLPSRAPELNPVENVWQHLRQNWLSNRVFENYDAIIDAACDA